ncbi:hypothetical protein [Cohnella rhizosphaerae]|uniref:Uncharacterized protein n=1 Tax=Cohnella rhizosphaerae TaxID=1457232 RepID=A0A9X4KNW6_9BACL|nr:hypothetical protein [Cohnella rhizosphaerae]MDG0808067.1 hypothetical protein [Cohnella rhizosphaerae]
MSKTLLNCFSNIYIRNPKKQVSVLVFDNLETIFHSEKLMDELGNLIVLLDDRRYAQYNVKFVIVGVPSGIIEYFSKTKNLTTISNRLSEISEVTRLNADQVTSFIKSGFIEELMINFESSSLYKKYEDHIAWVTNGIPQRLHEYCLEVCYFCEENNWSAKDQYLNLADQKWVAKSLSKNYVVIDNIMNSKETTVGTEILQTSTARSQSTSASSSPES